MNADFPTCPPLLLPLLFVAAAAADSSGQGPAAPPVAAGPRLAAALAPPAVPAAEVLQVHLVRLPGDPPGTWTASLSVRGLDPAWGGRGSTDLLIGRYDALADSFSPTLVAAPCNTEGAEFGGMLDGRGLQMVFERDGRMVHARRLALGQLFDPGRLIGNAPESTAGYYDPAIGLVDGQTVLFYQLGGTIRMDLFDPIDSVLYGPSLTVVAPRSTAGQANSPTPVTDRTGEVRGLLHHDLLGGDNDMYLTLDLDPATPSHLLLDTPTWLNNGGYAGGSFFSAESSPAPYHVVRLDSVWMTGGEAMLGRLATLDFFVPPAPAAAPSTTFLMLGTRFAPVPLPVPGIGGSLGLDPLGIAATVPVGIHPPATGQATFPVRVPNDPELLGASIPVQGLTLVEARSWTFSNSSSLRVARGIPPRTVVLVYDGQDHVVQAPIDPDRPALTIELDRSAPLPIEILALDLAGLPLTEPLPVDPGWMNTISRADAASYVVRMPLGAGGAVLRLQDDPWAGAKTHQAEGSCGTTREWYKLDLPKGKVCIKMQAKKKLDCSECPVEWRIVRRDNMFLEDSGTLDPARILWSQRCIDATTHSVEYQCPTGSPRAKCRLTVMFRAVKDCSDCEREDRRPAQ